MANESIFFTIPLEIRRKIYRLLLAGPHTILHPFNFFATNPYMCQTLQIQSPRPKVSSKWMDSVPMPMDNVSFWSSQPDLAILAVSRQICGEASSVFYGDSWFGVPYIIAKMDSAQNVQHLRLGAPAVDLRQVRRLILSFEENVYWTMRSETLINEINTVLKFCASHTASLAYLGINLSFTNFCWSEKEHVYSMALEDPDLLQILNSFTVREEISIRLVQRDLTLADSVEQWAVSVAERKDLFIFKHKVRHLFLGRPLHDSVDWSVVPRGRMPLAAWNFSADKAHLPVAGKTVDSTEEVVDLCPYDEDTEEYVGWNALEDELDEQDEEEVFDHEGEPDNSDDISGDDDDS